MLVMMFLVLAAALKALGEPLSEIFRLLAGAGGIGVLVVLALSGGRRALNRVVRALADL
ncbi:hypothetical protein ACFWNR_39580 [Streptomyces virginiae]|uniref:hypothetical protein n=1 Tax=Streptomyces virginiae TaxID=1961 RepID=UPI00365E15F1